LQDGKYGYLVPVSDPVAMAAGISQAIDNPVAVSFLHDAVKPFSEKEVIANHFDVLGIRT
jgi:glycosyltransferase involved in cell wall biosynthesis